jgi:peptide/nickel transport system permease protein
MRNYIIRRLLLLIPIMILVSFMTHATFRVIPGSAAHLICTISCTEEVVADIEEQYGLDENFFQQYGEWLGVYPDDDKGDSKVPILGVRGKFSGVLQGDFGVSFLNTGQTVSDRLGRTLPVTLELMALSLLFAVVLGIPPGVLSAIRPGSTVDLIVRLTSVAWLSVPNFYLAILVIAIGSNQFGWLPPNFATGNAVRFWEDPIQNLETFFFPSLVLSLGIAAVIMRLTRSSMLEVMRNDYVRTAWSKGLKERTVVWRHALKNAMIPVLTIIGLQVGALIGGAVLIESVFALNGIGRYLLVSVIGRDLLVVQSLVLIFAFVFVVINLIVDVLYAWLDPRIRYG